MMTRTRSILCGSVLMTAVAATWWGMQRDAPHGHTVTANSKPTVASLPQPSEKPTVVVKPNVEPAPQKRQGEFGIVDLYRKGFAARLSPKVAEFLLANRHSPAALLTVWFWTGDAAAGEQLMASGKTDPLACLASLAFSDGKLNQKQQLELVAECLRANPDDQSLRVFFAALSGATGDAQSCLDTLAQLDGTTKVDLGEARYQIAARDLMARAGIDLREAAQASVAGVNSIQDRLALTFRGALNPIMESLPVASEQEKITLVTKAIGFTSMLWNGREVWNGIDLRLSIMERGMLRRLPPDVEYGAQGKTVAERIAELETMLPRLEAAEKELIPYLENTDTATLATFLQKMDNEGKPAAALWLRDLKAARGD
jgi:hypothetical protein